MLTRRVAVVLGALAACQASTETEADRANEPPPVAAAQPPPPARFDQPAKVARHMRWHLEDLRTTERFLLAGQLDDAKAVAFLLTLPEKDPGIAPWALEATRASLAASAMSSAGGVDDALRKQAKLAQACAECHLHVQKLPVLAPMPPVPADEPTQVARMARHQWAADRLLEGVVGAAEDRWRGGLEVLSTTPLPYAKLTDAPALAAGLQARAKQALENRTTESLDARTTTYGELLVTCGACHVTLGKHVAK